MVLPTKNNTRRERAEPPLDPDLTLSTKGGTNVRTAMTYNVCNKNAVAKRTLIDTFPVSEAMVHFTFLLLLTAVALLPEQDKFFRFHKCTSLPTIVWAGLQTIEVHTRR